MSQATVQRALTEIRNGKTLDAYYLIKDVIESGFYIKDLFYLYGHLASQVGKHEDAAEAYSKELEKQPNHTLSKNALQQISSALNSTWGSKTLSEREWHSSIPKAVLDSIQKGVHNFHYKDVPLLKNPFDFAIYQMLLWDVKPKTIIEIGSKFGGSAYWMAELSDQFGFETHIHSIDIVKVENVEHSKITFYKGDGRNLQNTFDQEFLKTLPRPLLVIEDADHTYETSKAVLEFFHPYLLDDDIIIIEDGIITDLSPGNLSGPHRAIKEFMGSNEQNYEIIPKYVDFFGYNATWNTNGIFKKITPNESDSISPDLTELVAKIDSWPNDVFDALNAKKANGDSTLGLDYLRAKCFIQFNKTADAIQALYEELAHHPNSTLAKNELNKIRTNEANDANYPDEFKELLKRIRPYTMLSDQRLFSLYSLAKKACIENIGGNFVECGVARGGSTALLAWVSARYSKTPRKVFAFDSYAGMPAPTSNDTHEGNPAENTGWGKGTINSPLSQLKQVANSLNVWEHIVPVEGLFEHTIPATVSQMGMISLLHADGDWYESTKTIFEGLYSLVQPNGFVQIDDYGYWEGCAKAINEYQEAHSQHFNLHKIDSTGVWFQKPFDLQLNDAISVSTEARFKQVDPEKMGIVSQMSLNERLQMYHVLTEMLPDNPSVPIRFIEIGSYSGASMVLETLALSQRFGDNIQGIVIEPGGSPEFYQLVNKLSPKITHFKDYSFNVDGKLRSIFLQDNNYPAFIFVDGDHSYEGVKKDIEKYYPLLAKGGIIAFHDFLPPLDEKNSESILFHHGGNEPGIRQACQELMEDFFEAEILDVPIPYPNYPEQTQAQLPVIPGVFSSLRFYRKPDFK